MARKLFERQGIRLRGGALATGRTFVVYSDEAGTVLADISATSGGSPIAGSTITVAAIDGLGPASFRVWGPTDDTAVLYLRDPDDPGLGVQEIEAEPEAGGGGAHPDLATHDALGLATDAELTTHAGAADPHTGYVLESAHTEAAHDTLGLVTDAILATHAAAADPHTGYVLESAPVVAHASRHFAAGADPIPSPSTLQLGGSGFREPYQRHTAAATVTAFTSGVMALIAVPLWAGDVVGKLWFVTSSTALTMGSNADGHLWFALYDSTKTLMSQSADAGGATTWTANTWKGLALGAAQTIVTTGLYYVGVMVNAGTGGSPAMPTLRGTSMTSTVISGGTAGGPSGLAQLTGTNGSGLGATAPAGPLTITDLDRAPYCVLTPS